MERRHDDRRDLNEETSIFTKDGYFTAILANISMGGLFLRTNKPIQIGETIEVTIPLPGHHEKKELVVMVTAARIVDGGIAFQFTGMDDAMYSALLHLTSGAHV